MSTRAIYEELLGLREPVEDLRGAINDAAARHAGRTFNGTIFDPAKLNKNVINPTLKLLDPQDPRGELAAIRDLPPDQAVGRAIPLLEDVLTELAEANPNNGLPDLDPNTPVLLGYVHARLRDAIDATERVLDDLRTLGSPLAIPLGLQNVRQSVSDISAFPLLTDGSPAASRSDGEGPAPGNLQLLVDETVRDVIGRLPRYTDARAFDAALSTSFGIQDIDGMRTVTWRPRSYAGSGGLGASVTGIQASVYARALGARDAVLPLLECIRPLLPDFDQQEVDAARNVVRAELDALVEELGTDGGPRRARVDQLFEVLFDQRTSGPTGPVDGGMVGYLGFVFGFADKQGVPNRGQVNTIEEEQDFSSYILLTDHLRTVEHSWRSFLGQPTQDLGTSLFQLSRVLQVVAESIDEVESALDSVFVGDAERGVIRFDTSSSGEMLVDELLGWIRSFAATEAPTLIANSGRRGLRPIVDTATRLRGLNDDLVDEIATDPDLPDGMRHPRVRFPLQELRGYLSQVSILAQRAI